MSNQDLINWIETRLKEDLPGPEAHRRMLPTLPEGAPIRISHDNPPREGAVLMLLYEEEGDLKFPLIQRPTYAGVHSGQMALPGGKRESSDSDLYYTALRESEEEIGVYKDEITILGSLSSFFVAASNYQVLPVIGFQDSVPRFDPDDHEVEEVVIANLSDLVNNDNIKRKDIHVSNGVRLDAPYFDLSDRVVWGATAMMLSEFVHIFGEIRHSL